MKHENRLNGLRFCLRPAVKEDSQFICRLRTDPILGRFIGDTSGQLSDQEAWFDAYYARLNDFYFVVERLDNSAQVGLISLYDVDVQKRQAEWGRWIIESGVAAAVESSWLIYKFGFEVLGLERIYCRTVTENSAVVSFHESCGLNTVREIKDYVLINGVMHNCVEQEITHAEWPLVESGLSKRAAIMARRI